MTMIDPLEQTAQLVAAYVANNLLPASALPDLLGTVHAAIVALDAPPPPPAAPLVPAVPVGKSVHHDRIVCLHCGKAFQSIKRHLGARHGLTPDAYRRQWGLGADYPMAAPDYSAARSALAISLGLGQPKGSA